jgi:hypothetical protein
MSYLLLGIIAWARGAVGGGGEGVEGESSGHTVIVHNVTSPLPPTADCGAGGGGGRGSFRPRIS